MERIIGLKKFTRVTPLCNALKVEPVSDVNFKHKIYFLKKLMRCPLCKEVFYSIRKAPIAVEKKTY